MRKTVILGASTNPARASFEAARRLSAKGESFVPVGIKKGELFGEQILDLRNRPAISDVDTVTLYLNAERQKEWEDYIFSLQPNRIIFNPGAENPELSHKAREKGILTENACTLVMLGTGVY